MGTVGCRFANNPFVKGGQVGFYAGTPLVASNGHRLGTLCFADKRPHCFDAGKCQLLHNMAELVVREVEREWALSRAVRERQHVEAVRLSPPSSPLLCTLSHLDDVMLLEEPR